MHSRLSRFTRDGSGNVAVIFGITILPILFLCGVAIDYSAAIETRSALQVATDGTAISLCQTAAGTTAPQMQEQAATVVHSYSPAKAAKVDPLTISTTVPRTITVTTRMDVTTRFGGVTGWNVIPVSASATCATPVPRTFEIALALDNTGSMAKSGGSGTKMQAAQQAATNFVTYISGNPAFSSSTRIALVPFAGAVAVNPKTFRYATWIDQKGVSTYNWRNITGASDAGFTSRFDIYAKLKGAYSGWDWKGCFDALPYPLNVQDGAPTSSSADSYYVPSLAPDEPGEGGTAGAYDSWGEGNFNSYIDDVNSDSSCKTQPNSELSALGRACKYKSPKDASPTTDSGTGIPNGPNFACTTQPLTRLTTDFGTIKSQITSMAPLGQTNIHDGLMWGWRTISPKSVFADGTAYGATGITKVLVLMTDGANSWAANPYNDTLGSVFSQFGYFKNADGSTPSNYFPSGTAAVKDAKTARDALDAITLEACTNAKAAGVTIYTIGFSVSSDPIDQQGISLLASCAGASKIDLSPPGGPYAYVSNDSSSLISAFAQIGNSIGSLRLTR